MYICIHVCVYIYILYIYILYIYMFMHHSTRGERRAKSVRRDRSLRMHSVCPPFHFAKATLTPASELAFVKWSIKFRCTHLETYTNWSSATWIQGKFHPKFGLTRLYSYCQSMRRNHQGSIAPIVGQKSTFESKKQLRVCLSPIIDHEFLMDLLLSSISYNSRTCNDGIKSTLTWIGKVFVRLNSLPLPGTIGKAGIT